MNTINVDLHEAIRPLHRELYDYPPKNVRYVDIIHTPSGKYQEIVTKWEKPSLWQRFKFFINNIYLLGELAAWMYREFAPTDEILGNSELVHLCNTWTSHYSKQRRRYVVDFENAGVFVSFKYHRLKMSLFKKQVEKNLCSEYCKKIIPITNAAKKSFEFVFDTSKFEDKIEVVYPAMHKVEVKNRKESDTVSLLFVGYGFHVKGGMEVLNAYKFLSKKYDVSLTMISNVPKKIVYKYNTLEGLNLLPACIPRQEIFDRYYSNADIFVLPTHYDSFGMVFLEAMAFGLPIVSTDHYAVPELVEDGKSGLLIKKVFSIFDSNYQFVKRNAEYLKTLQLFPNEVEDLIDKLSILIEDRALRKRMGKSGRKKVEKGKFSIKERNKKLRRIYEEALKK